MFSLHTNSVNKFSYPFSQRKIKYKFKKLAVVFEVEYHRKYFPVKSKRYLLCSETGLECE